MHVSGSQAALGLPEGTVMATTLVGDHVWTAPEVEAETEAGYFHQWQGDNERLNAWLAKLREEEARTRAWWEEYYRKHPDYQGGPRGRSC